MNLVQLGAKLGTMPISVIKSSEISILLKLFSSQINPNLTDGKKLNASTTGDDITKIFHDGDADIQAIFLQDIFDDVQTSSILDAILNEDKFQDTHDESARKKWGSVGGSVLILCVGVTLYILWGFVNQHGLKPPIPDATVGNMLTELIQEGIKMLISSVKDQGQ